MGNLWKKAINHPAGEQQHPWTLHGTRMETSRIIVETFWESSYGKFMEISWKKPATTQQVPKNDHGNSMQNAWNIHGNRGNFVGKFQWKVHGNFMGKASNTENLNVRRLPPFQVKKTTMETPWNILGNFMEIRGNCLGKFLWKVRGNFMEKPATIQQVKKHTSMETSWNMHGTFMENVEHVWESPCGKFMGTSLKKASNNPAGPKKNSHGNSMQNAHSWKIVEHFWESSWNKPATTAGQQKQPWTLHRAFF